MLRQLTSNQIQSEQQLHHALALGLKNLSSEDINSKYIHLDIAVRAFESYIEEDDANIINATKLFIRTYKHFETLKCRSYLYKWRSTARLQRNKAKPNREPNQQKPNIDNDIRADHTTIHKNTKNRETLTNSRQLNSNVKSRSQLNTIDNKSIRNRSTTKDEFSDIYSHRLEFDYEPYKDAFDSNYDSYSKNVDSQLGNDRLEKQLREDVFNRLYLDAIQSKDSRQMRRDLHNERNLCSFQPNVK